MSFSKEQNLNKETEKCQSFDLGNEKIFSELVLTILLDYKYNHFNF